MTSARSFPEIGSRWRHYKGGEYVVVGQDDVHVFYAPEKEWASYLAEQEVSGKECLLYARHVEHWESPIDVEGNIVPRFTRI